MKIGRKRRTIAAYTLSEARPQLPLRSLLTFLALSHMGCPPHRNRTSSSLLVGASSFDFFPAWSTQSCGEHFAVEINVGLSWHHISSIKSDDNGENYYSIRYYK
jgi:hypothetical protein